MAVSINTYRHRIGVFQFSTKKNKKFLKNKSDKRPHTLCKSKPPSISDFLCSGIFYLSLYLLIFSLKSENVSGLERFNGDICGQYLENPHNMCKHIKMSGAANNWLNFKLVTSFTHPQLEFCRSLTVPNQANIYHGHFYISLYPATWWQHGIKSTYCTDNTNKYLHSLYGNRRNIGYIIGSWNCGKGLISPTNNETDKLIDIKLLIEKKKPHLLSIIESDLHGPNSCHNRRVKYSETEIRSKLNIPGYYIEFADTWAVSYTHLTLPTKRIV